MTIADFFSRGHAADLALVFLAVEGVALWVLRGPDGERRFWLVAPFLAAGAALLLALRAALVGAPWWCVAAALALSGVAHAVDLARRLRA